MEKERTWKTKSMQAISHIVYVHRRSLLLDSAWFCTNGVSVKTISWSATYGSRKVGKLTALKTERAHNFSFIQSYSIQRLYLCNSNLL